MNFRVALSCFVFYSVSTYAVNYFLHLRDDFKSIWRCLSRVKRPRTSTKWWLNDLSSSGLSSSRHLILALMGLLKTHTAPSKPISTCFAVHQQASIMLWRLSLCHRFDPRHFVRRKPTDLPWKFIKIMRSGFCKVFLIEMACKFTYYLRRSSGTIGEILASPNHNIHGFGRELLDQFDNTKGSGLCVFCEQQVRKCGYYCRIRISNWPISRQFVREDVFLRVWKLRSAKAGCYLPRPSSQEKWFLCRLERMIPPADKTFDGHV